MSRIRQHTEVPTLAQRYVGASVAALATGVTVGLLFAYGNGQFHGLFGLVAGMFAIGIAAAVLFTFGVGASVLIDRLLGTHPNLSLVAHGLIGAGAGALVGFALFDSDLARLAVFVGLLAAHVASLVARRAPHSRAAWAPIALAGTLGILGLAWWLSATL